MRAYSFHQSISFNTTRLLNSHPSLAPDLVYAIAKRRAEALADEAASAGVPVVIVRPGEVYGPDDRDHVTCGTLIDFARWTHGKTVRQAIEDRDKDWVGKCYCDYSYHVMVEGRLPPEIFEQIGEAGLAGRQE